MSCTVFQCIFRYCVVHKVTVFLIRYQSTHPFSGLTFQEANECTAEDIRKSTGVEVKCYTCDVTDYAQVKATAAKVRQDMGHVDILVNNAGIANPGTILELTEASITKTIQIHILALFWVGNTRMSK